MSALVEHAGARILFCLPPRCGSNYVREFLRRNQIPFRRVRAPGYSTAHCPYSAACRVESHDRLFRLARERDSWLESVWRFSRKTGFRAWDPGGWHPFRTIEHIRHDDFERWLEEANAVDPDFHGRTMRLFGGERAEAVTIKTDEIVGRMAELFGAEPWEQVINAA